MNSYVTFMRWTGWFVVLLVSLWMLTSGGDKFDSWGFLPNN